MDFSNKRAGGLPLSSLGAATVAATVCTGTIDIRRITVRLNAKLVSLSIRDWLVMNVSPRPRDLLELTRCMQRIH